MNFEFSTKSMIIECDRFMFSIDLIFNKKKLFDKSDSIKVSYDHIYVTYMMPSICIEEERKKNTLQESRKQFSNL